VEKTVLYISLNDISEEEAFEHEQLTELF